MHCKKNGEQNTGGPREEGEERRNEKKEKRAAGGAGVVVKKKKKKKALVRPTGESPRQQQRNGLRVGLVTNSRAAPREQHSLTKRSNRVNDDRADARVPPRNDGEARSSIPSARKRARFLQYMPSLRDRKRLPAPAREPAWLFAACWFLAEVSRKYYQDYA